MPVGKFINTRLTLRSEESSPVFHFFFIADSFYAIFIFSDANS